MKEVFKYRLEDIDSVAQDILNLTSDAQAITLQGNLGAGKTSLIKRMLYLQGIKENILSPTFTYFLSYKSPEGKIIYHFDLYRIKTLNDFLDQGFQEYLQTPNSVSLIEWPEVIAGILPAKTYRIKLDYLDETTRVLTLENHNL